MIAKSRLATVEVPFEALAEEPGVKKAIEFIRGTRRGYGDSVVELKEDERNPTFSHELRSEATDNSMGRHRVC